MSVTQLKDGRWLCRYPKGKDTERPSTSKKYFERGKIGQQKAWDFNSHLGLGKQRSATTPTFTLLANKYILAKEFAMTTSSYDGVCDQLESTILPLLGNYMAHKLTPSVLDDFIKKRRTKHIKKDGKNVQVTIKMTTIKGNLAIVRAILNFAVKRRFIASSPMQGYELPKEDNAVIMPPSKPELETIAACAVPHIKRAIWISYYTGLRPGKIELLSLKWEHIDFTNRTLMVTSADKGGIPVRMVPLNDTILKMFEQWLDADMKNKKLNTPYIINYHGGNVASIKKAWGSAKKRAKITRRIRLYDIRHAFITTLLEKKADLKSVSEIAGHASPETTMRIYQHVSSGLKRDAVNLLD